MAGVLRNLPDADGQALARIGRAGEERPATNLLDPRRHGGADLGQAVVPSFVLDECLSLGLGVAMLVEPAVHLDLHLVARGGAQAKPAAEDFAAALKRAAGRLVG